MSEKSLHSSQKEISFLSTYVNDVYMRVSRDLNKNFEWF